MATTITIVLDGTAIKSVDVSAATLYSCLPSWRKDFEANIARAKTELAAAKRIIDNLERLVIE